MKESEITVTYRCDVCLKSEVHVSQAPDNPPGWRTIVLLPFKTGAIVQPGINEFDACSEECAARGVSIYWGAAELRPPRNQTLSSRN
jgi:hypothetical protein